ncbi:flagellar biosynthesis protein FlhF [Paenibacillus spiritus]|uniref:Flagellar biosynthesis protein FlhF n=1 Tax=Paenibacillus spiritus TaxID=2496557 RepID=A0A5J5GDY3_9BACL|nr:MULTISPECIES: flagellar biosynthesis protein FlhF [Paenibacillus]KAA9006409.1 flagellar biosynthesis protein FlhF [Paenibacillus spiritus]
MRVKRYVVDTMPDAMHSIRSELGSDAVILSTKEIRTGGILGMFRKKRIEVVAAVENEAPPRAASASPRGLTPVPKGFASQAYRQAAAGAGASAVAVASAEQQEPPKSFAEMVAALTAETNSPAEQAPDTDAIREPALHNVDTNTDNTLTEPKSAGPDDTALLREVREMKHWMERIARQSPGAPEFPEELERLRSRLMEQELDARLIDRWSEEVMISWKTEGQAWERPDFEAAFDRCIREFLDGRVGGGIPASTKVLYIAGPTGVGKTTTIAKLAADQLFRHGRKVGMITSDTYRISAVEQLRTYASILNVPLEVVQSPGDMQRALSRLEACDLILMDTAGRNFRNEMLVAELQSMLAPSLKSETYLVLSLTSKSRDMKQITEHFSKYQLDKVIFTKMDETGSYGSLFNLLEDYPLTLSYMTNGQNVPDDLLMCSEALLSGLLLGAGGH